MRSALRLGGLAYLFCACLGRGLLWRYKGNFWKARSFKWEQSSHFQESMYIVCAELFINGPNLFGREYGAVDDATFLKYVYWLFSSHVF